MGEFHFVGKPTQPPPARRHSGCRFHLLRARRLGVGVLALFLALGCGTGNRPNSREKDTRPRASGVATPALKVGDRLPPPRAEGWLNGPPSAPDSPGVRLLVVDAWGQWCPFCQKTAPGLLRVYEKYSEQGVAFVHKPFTPEQLRDTVLRITGISHEQAAAAHGADAGDDLDF